MIVAEFIIATCLLGILLVLVRIALTLKNIDEFMRAKPKEQMSEQRSISVSAVQETRKATESETAGGQEEIAAVIAIANRFLLQKKKESIPGLVS